MPKRKVSSAAAPPAKRCAPSQAAKTAAAKNATKMTAPASAKPAAKKTARAKPAAKAARPAAKRAVKAKTMESGLSPADRWVRALCTEVNELKAKGMELNGGYLIIRGIPEKSWDDDTEEPEATGMKLKEGHVFLRGLLEKNWDEATTGEPEDGKRLCTEAEVAHMRIILTTDRRVRRGWHADDHITEGESMFNSRFSYDVIERGNVYLRMLKMIKNPALKFDHLLGLTRALTVNNDWQQFIEPGWGDHFGGAAMLADLGKEWKAMLKIDDAKLEIDSKYTRPGVICLLEDFQREVKDMAQALKHCIGRDEGVAFKFR